jgi:hypothetical protein
MAWIPKNTFNKGDNIYGDAVVVTPSDTSNLPYLSDLGLGTGTVTSTGSCRALYIGSTGSIQVTTRGGNKVILEGLQAGAVYPLSVIQVWNTSTTAGGIIALY